MRATIRSLLAFSCLVVAQEVADSEWEVRRWRTRLDAAFEAALLLRIWRHVYDHM